MSQTLKTPSAVKLDQATIEKTEDLNSYVVTDSETGFSISVQATSEAEALKIFKTKLATIKKPL